MALAVAAALVAGCGGQVTADDTSPEFGATMDASVVDTGSPDVDAEASAPDAAAADVDAGPDAADGGQECYTSLGPTLCGPASGCPDLEIVPQCVCTTNSVPTGEPIGFCLQTTGALSDGNPAFHLCAPTPDSALCANISAPSSSNGWFTVPIVAGDLMFRRGFADRVRNADSSGYTGAAIPDPACQDLTPATVCGGSCGTCPTGLTCVGRSPSHPLGICATYPGKMCKPSHPTGCPANEGCFTWLVGSTDQALADLHSFCVPLDQCNAATAITGGARCTP
jgi:hypothetical protein